MGGEINGEQEGWTIMDIKTGMPATSTMTQKYRGELNVQGTEVTLNMDVKTTLQLQER